MSFRILVIAAVMATAATAFAESLEEKQYWKGQMDYVQRSIDAVKNTCKVTLKFDWVNKAELRKKAEAAGHTPNGICTAIVDQLDTICREGAESQAAVKAKIKAVKCGYAAKRSLAMGGGTVTYMGNNVEANFSDWAGPWLKKKL
jgi:hypothetical protein